MIVERGGEQRERCVADRGVVEALDARRQLHWACELSDWGVGSPSARVEKLRKAFREAIFGRVVHMPNR